MTHVGVLFSTGRVRFRVKRSKSPCIGVYEFSHQHYWCLGCDPARKECQQWKTMKPFTSNILMKELHKRMVQIEKEPIE